MSRFLGRKSESRRETTLTHGSGTSHDSGASHTTAHADTLTEGRELIRKGDDYRNQGEFDIYSENISTMRLGDWGSNSYFNIHLRKSNESADHSSPGQPRMRMRDKIRAWLKSLSHKPTSTGPFFPRNDQSHALLFMSQATDMPKGSVCTFSNAKDTNDIVVSFIQADDETKNILRGQIYDIIAQFKDSLGTLETVRELVTLARIPDRDIFVQIIEQLLKITKDSLLVPIITLQGLAVATNSCPDGIDMSGIQGIYLDILRPLKQQLEMVRSDGNEGQLIPFLHALTALLNAMVCRGVHALDREGIFNPINSMLDELKGHHNPTVRFLVLYVKQGLAYVGNDESLGTSLYRHGRLAFSVADDISDGVSNVDLGKFVSAYNRVTEMSDFTINAKWYQGLIYVGCTLDLQDWSRFERFVLESKLRSDEYFLQGVCLLLEQAAATQSVQEIRDGAIEFLHSLSVNSSEQVRLAAVAVLERLVSPNCTRHNNTNTKHHVKTIKCTCTTYQDTRFCPPPVWDPSWHTTSSGILLKAVQQKKQNDKNMDEIPAKLDKFKDAVALHASDLQAGMDILVDGMAPKSSLVEIHAALESYYKSSLVIRRVSGVELDLELCYINLVVVEARGQREKDKSNLKSHAVAFQRIPSRGESTDADITSSIPLENLFDKRNLPNGDEYVPKKILIHGRAGIGKSTLCKKLVHLYQGGLWRDQFDAVLWLPLRQLKSNNYCNIDGLLNKKYFFSQPKREALSRTVSALVDAGRVLFILDGLDEIVISTGEENDDALRVFLLDLLQKEHVVITTRPSGVDKNILQGIDLELETIGFSPQNVDDYLHIPEVLPLDQIKPVQEYIGQTSVVQGLVNIPVLLDAICFSWGSVPIDEKEEITITSLYQTIVRKLWCKDATRLGKSSSGETLKEAGIHSLEPYQIDELMDAEIEFLGYLAFKGLEDNHRIEFDKETLDKVMRDLDQNRMRAKKESLPIQLIPWLKETSFLHTSDTDLDTNPRNFQRTWYFLHLTFQEYFAATWLARHLQVNSNDGEGPSVLMTTPEATKAFVLKQKYNPRYEIVWWMVAGQLGGETLVSFFNILQGSPVDLIGGYHHHLLAVCLKEGRNQLGDKRIKSLETQLARWLQLEMTANNGSHGRGTLGSMGYFPEELLIRSLSQSSASEEYLVRTLDMRTSLTQSTMRALTKMLQGSGRSKGLAASMLGKQPALPEFALLALSSALQDEDWDVRRRAVEALGKQSFFPDSALVALICALQDENEHVRDRAAEALGGQSALPESALLGALQHENECARCFAADALGRQSTLTESALLVLIDALEDENTYVRYSAVKILGEQSTLPESILLAVIGALRHENEDIRIGAAYALGTQLTLTESALQALIGALQHENKDVRHSIVRALGKQMTIPESVLQALAGALQDENEYVRYSAACVLGRHSMLPNPALQALIDALQHKNEDIRISSAKALGTQSTLPRSVLQGLIGALQDENGDVRYLLVKALGKQSTLPESVLKDLIGALQDENGDVRYLLVKALGKQSTLPESTLQVLIDASQDENENVRYSALLALIGALQDKNWRVRDLATRALGRQSSLPESALLALIAALQDEYKDVRNSAAYTLGMQSTLPESALLALIGALQDKEGHVRKSVAEALGKQSTLLESALLALVDALRDEDEDVTNSATIALGRQSTLPEFALLALVDALRDKNVDFWRSAITALGTQSTLSESALLILIGALQDKNVDVRRSATEELGKQSTLPESALLALI
ncbi:hypothetical protein BGX20_000925, partial [Mortierella sp. AD010]